MTIKLALLIILFTAMVIGAVATYVTSLGGKISVIPIPGIGIGVQKIIDYVQTEEYGQVVKTTIYLELIFVYIMIEWAKAIGEDNDDDETSENLAYGN